MNERNLGRLFFLALAALLTSAVILGIASAQQLNMTVEVQDTIGKYNTPTSVNITIPQYGYSEGLLGFEIHIVFNNSLLNINDVVISSDFPLSFWNYFPGSNNKIKLTASSQNGIPIDQGYVLATLNVTPLRNDGSWDYINITYSKFTIETQPTTIGSAVTLNGTFTTLDEVPPTIIFDRANYSTVGPNLDVTATLYDLSGINESSIEVYINETKLTEMDGYTVSKINNTTWSVMISKSVSELLNVELPHNVKIMVKASDAKGNSAREILIITAANIGFFNPCPPVNGYVKTKDVTITVKYSQIDPDTIKMFFDGNNVTSNTIVDKTTNTVSYTATGLSERTYTVKVNGTGVDGNEWSLTWSFTVDMTPPTITFFTVKDSDGDGFNETFENLTAYWNVSDLNFDRVEIVYDGNVVKTVSSANASATFTLDRYGGYITLRAYDKAGNVSDSSAIGLKYYVYNNYVAYVKGPKKTVLGGQLDLTKIATLDFMDPGVVEYEFIGASGFSLPLNNAERLIIPGSKANYTVVVDENANKTLSQFPDTAVIFDENAMLDFYIKAPARGLIMVIKLNDSEAKHMGEDLLEKGSLKGFGLENLTKLMEYAYIFDERGWVQAKYDENTGNFKAIGSPMGQFTLQDKLKEIIDKHNVDLTSGFKLSDHDANYTARPVLEKGYYALVVVDVDTLKDVTAIDLAVPFVVLNGSLSASKPNVVNPSVIVGDKVKLEFPVTFNAASAIMLRKVDYTTRVEMDLTEGILEVANVTLGYGSKPIKEITLFGKSTNIYVPEGMFKGAYTTKDTNIFEIDTSGLDPGEYRIYVVTVDKDFTTLYAGELTVTLTQDTVKPTIDIDVKSANATAVVLHYKFADNNLLDKVYMRVKYPDNTVSEILDKSNVRKEVFEGDLVIDVSAMSEVQVLEILAEATDVSGNKAAEKLTATKPVIANANETKVLKPVGGVAVELVAGAKNTTVVVLATTAKKPEEVNVTKSPPLNPVKFIRVHAKVVNGTVPRWVLKVTYTNQEIAGLDERSLVLYYWDELNQTWKNLKDYVNRKVDPTHRVYSYKHDMSANTITVILSNLSIFSLGGKSAAKAPPAYAGGKVGAGGGYVITPAPTATVPTPTATLPTPTQTIPAQTPTPKVTPTTTPTAKPTVPPVPTWAWVVAAVLIVGMIAAFLYMRKRA